MPKLKRDSCHNLLLECEMLSQGLVLSVVAWTIPTDHWLDQPMSGVLQRRYLSKEPLMPMSIHGKKLGSTQKGVTYILLWTVSWK